MAILLLSTCHIVTPHGPCYNITEFFCDAFAALLHLQHFPSTHAYCDLGLNAFCGVAGSFYSDLPQVESVGVTLQYDMGAPLHSPIWLDGYQFFQVSSDAGLLCNEPVHC